MPAPGEYLADVTEGITRVEDLPKATTINRTLAEMSKAVKAIARQADNINGK